MKRGRPPVLTEEVTTTIGKIKQKHPNWSVREIQKKIPQFNPSLKGKVPGRTKVNDYIRETYTPNLKRQIELGYDNPWNLDALKDNPLPPEVLPKLFPLWLKRQETRTEPPLSIRQVRWITQLSSMTDDIELLGIVADMCAEWELIGALTETPQLSSPVTVLQIYAWLIRMSDKELNEHYEEILREKLVSATPPEETLKTLQGIYGDEFLKAMKLKSKEANEA